MMSLLRPLIQATADPVIFSVDYVLAFAAQAPQKDVGD